MGVRFSRKNRLHQHCLLIFLRPPKINIILVKTRNDFLLYLKSSIFLGSLSPFVTKLETFLRVADLRYICEYEFPNHPETGTSPWITINGQDVADSQLSVEYLMKRFNKDLR